MNRIIGVDIDGVLSDIAGHLVRFVEDTYGYVIQADQIVSENIEKCTDLTINQVAEIFSRPVFFQSLPLIASSRDALISLNCNRGWRVVLMTDRFWYPTIKEDTIVWLQQNDVPYHSISVVNKTNRAILAKELGIDFFIEDQLSNANSLAKVCQRVFLVNRSYNRGVTSPVVSRVGNVSEVLSIISSY